MRGFGLAAVFALLVPALPLACGTANLDSAATGGAAGAGGDAPGSGASNASAGDGGTNSGNDGGTNAQGGSRPNGGSAGMSSECDAGTQCPGALCGNNVIDAGETCDEGDRTPFDGCSASCQIEPDCIDGCPTTCGDGFVVEGEACDDGNVEPNDGCSSDCTIEPGFTCSAQICEQTTTGCALRVAAVFRDFNASGGGHPDFEPLLNSIGVIPDLVETELDLEGKPVQSATATDANGFMHGQEAFAQWYRDAPGVNATIPGEIMLYDNNVGGYVNRWGANGQAWVGQGLYTNLRYCGAGGGACAEYCLPLAPGEQCWDPCIPWGSNVQTCAGTLMQTTHDGNPMFFPIDPPTPNILTDARFTSLIAPDYGWNWATEATAATDLGIVSPIAVAAGMFPSTERNFHFTTEVKILFRYEAARTLVLDFTGDDDVWVFVNGTLALDLGGWHTPLDGSVTIDSTTATNYGLVDGGVYSLAMFHAERQTDGSSFRLSLTGLELERSVCVPN